MSRSVWVLLKILDQSPLDEICQLRVDRTVLGLCDLFDQAVHFVIQPKLEGEDFYSFLSKTPTGGRPAQDAALSIDMAKEICMIQRNEKGKLARQYFLALERDWNSPERVMARALEIAHKKLRCLEEQRELDRPKVLFANAVAAARTSILVGELAKVLKQNGVDMGQNRLFTWLRENGYLIRRNGSDYNMPTQKAMEMGLFEIKETVVAHADGHTDTKKTPKVTGRGQQYFINKFLGN